MTDLLEANAALLAAVINVSNARTDAVLAYKKLLTTTGTILNK